MSTKERFYEPESQQHSLECEIFLLLTLLPELFHWLANMGVSFMTVTWDKPCTFFWVFLVRATELDIWVLVLICLFFLCDLDPGSLFILCLGILTWGMGTKILLSWILWGPMRWWCLWKLSGTLVYILTVYVYNSTWYITLEWKCIRKQMCAA